MENPTQKQSEQELNDTTSVTLMENFKKNADNLYLFDCNHYKGTVLNEKRITKNLAKKSKLDDINLNKTESYNAIENNCMTKISRTKTLTENIDKICGPIPADSIVPLKRQADDTPKKIETKLDRLEGTSSILEDEQSLQRSGTSQKYLYSDMDSTGIKYNIKPDKYVFSCKSGQKICKVQTKNEIINELANREHIQSINFNGDKFLNTANENVKKFVMKPCSVILTKISPEILSGNISNYAPDSKNKRTNEKTYFHSSKYKKISNNKKIINLLDLNTEDGIEDNLNGSKGYFEVKANGKLMNQTTIESFKSSNDELFAQSYNQTNDCLYDHKSKELRPNTMSFPAEKILELNYKQEIAHATSIIKNPFLSNNCKSNEKMPLHSKLSSENALKKNEINNDNEIMSLKNSKENDNMKVLGNYSFEDFHLKYDDDFQESISSKMECKTENNVIQNLKTCTMNNLNALTNEECNCPISYSHRQTELLVRQTEKEENIEEKYKFYPEPFLQHLPCFKLRADKYDVSICRECRRGKSSDQTSNDIYCRFLEFRRLKYDENGKISVAGFPNPFIDPKRDDIIPWRPDDETEPTAGYMDIQVCRYILLHVGDQFCYLWRQEAEALELHENLDDTIAWKKAVKGVREICDVCETTLFNYHWTCPKCGFGVCIDCFKDRKENISCRKIKDKDLKGCDEFHWLFCTSSETLKPVPHNLSTLMLTQIIPGDSLCELGNTMHYIRNIWKIPQICDCLLSHKNFRSLDSDIIVNDMILESRLQENTCESSLATKETFRQQLRLDKLHEKKLKFAKSIKKEYIAGRIWEEETIGEDPIENAYDQIQHINFLRPGLAGLRRFVPPKVMMLTDSPIQSIGVPHKVLCNGKLLLLTNPINPGNRMLFQNAWKSGQPVMISNVSKSLNLSLWRPEAFCDDFGDKPNDLINCLNGNLVPNQPMRHFWEGFQNIHKRLLDSNREPMLLKLKDWPPGDDFAEILPTRFADLMNGLPMPEYTLRTGNLNLASCLPKMFVPPDLGPKMYNAYGSALYTNKGTTNLHLDISDAVNIMVYVGIPDDTNGYAQINAANKAITLGGCDYLTRQRLYSSEEKPIAGALWHIFSAQDADKIRDLLNRVTLENGYRLEPDHDPIHDQNWYLDDKLRARLYNEYQVECFPIVQCLGDAVFIPAGAPHQVQNLHNCIKVAEDFVSPENITHCVHLTHEFRRLSSSHTNHEDKLQIKNIIYHAIKDCCTILKRAMLRNANEKLQPAQKPFMDQETK